MNYTTENCMSEIVNRIPGFTKDWQEHLADWDGKSAGLILDLIEFATYTNRLLEKEDAAQVKNIFALIESMMSESADQKLTSSISTGFLESVINPVTDTTPYLPLLSASLGEKSKAYCKEWLQFSGINLANL